MDDLCFDMLGKQNVPLEKTASLYSNLLQVVGGVYPILSVAPHLGVPPKKR